MKKPLALHPFLFAIFPILFLLSHNITQVSYREILLPLACVVGLTALVVLASSLIFRRSQKVAPIVSVSLLLFFAYGRAYDLVQGWQIGGHLVGRHAYLLLAWAEVFASCVYWLVRSRGRLDDLSRLLNVVALSLVLFSVLRIGSHELRTTPWFESGETDPVARTEPGDPADATALPDIYYIVLDGYASNSVLKQTYGFDNRRFTDGLTERGFYVAHQSRSNYAHTFLSLASSLNMDYVNHLSDVVGEQCQDRAIPYRMIKDSAVLRFLRSRGYRVIHFSSGWGPTLHNPYADLNVHCGGPNEFTVVLLRTTLLRPLERDFAWSLRNRVLCTFFFFF